VTGSRDRVDLMTSHAYAFDHPHTHDDAELTALLGGKGANLAKMTRVLRLPVPPGFTVTTETCRQFLAGGWPDGLDAEIDRQIGLLEQRVGRRLGDPDDPLLVSVRSGAPASMPGMMDTILNLGLNDVTASGLARSSNESFARGCHERFVRMYRSIVAVDEVPESPRDPLRGAIAAVFASWNCDRARAYRTVEGIDHDVGTAVTVQTMVFGNRGDDSATGVLFSRDPSTGEAVRFGDVLFNAQGEDVVDGSHATEPLDVLADRLPGVAEELWRAADLLERHERDLCDIEFTIEQGALWLLQVRVGKRSPKAALRIAVDMAEDPDFPLSRREAVERVAPLLVDPPRQSRGPAADVAALTTGLGASPGMATGQIATSSEASVRLAESGVPVILVLHETSPADVHGMAAAAGILTSRGGVASHAAVVARGWGIAAVVGAAAVVIHDDFVDIADRSFAPGDVLTIDGDTGQVFAGAVAGTSEPVPEVAVLRRWADELGVGRDALPSDGQPDTARGSRAAVVADGLADAVVQVTSIKNFVTVDGLVAAIGASPEAVTAALEQLVADALVDDIGRMHRLSQQGLDRARQLLAGDQARWGIATAETALVGLHALDVRMKQIVTRWQLRTIDGTEALNDHTDEAHDRDVLAALAELHEEAGPWLDDLAAGLARLDRYRSRLDDALERAASGDGRFVAGPMIDSYHTVWFEMHEDLIRLAGKTREAEAAAGRA
jgi:pyruvate,orthophosphate dikinase